MNLKQLECFDALAKTLNFTKAAEQVYVSQSAFSRQISSLEEELGCTLILRSKTDPKLTQAGEKISIIAANILTDVARIESIAAHAEKGMEERYVAGTLIGGLMPEERAFMHTFYRTRRQVRFDIKEYDEGGLLQALEREKTDFAFFTGLWNDELEKFDTFFIGTKQLMFICGKNHRFAERESIRAEELKNEKIGLINPEKNRFFSDQIKNMCLAQGFMPQFDIAADSIFSLVDYIEADMTSSVMLENIFSLSPKGIVGIPIEEAPLCSQLLLIRKDDHRPLIEEIREYAENVLKE